MPHGSYRVGDVEVVALCDAVVEASRTLEEAYPRVPLDAWPALRTEHPETVGHVGRWLLHVHAYLVRASGRTVLFDAGIGPPSGPAFAWAAASGRLPGELSAAGAETSDVDLVVISHGHDDHLGWTATDELEPLFPNARYLFPRADAEVLRRGDDEEGAEIWRRTLAPLEAAGVLDLVDGAREVAPAVDLASAPGHTPGHQVLWMGSGRDAAVLSADVTNHPAQVGEPSWSAEKDGDPDLAADTRVDVLDRAAREGRVYVTSHFAEPFGRLVETSHGRRFVPLEA
jgi:glyoxylase-like metal-dependent hydrolase (beta-lactamase superfamily II)